ncbi:uncharacterized protein [Acropora muricata]|uniref:uncharacterized protein n=1 Tax=Acropora muricata TaxID=159855 RepID=UPI0034E3C994
MNSALQLIFFLALLSQFYFTHACQDGECRQLLFPSSLQKTGRRLIGHNITIKQVRDIDECEWRCYQQPCCVSINFRTTANTEKRHRCELNNATYKQYAGKLAENNGFIYRGAETPCESSPCKNGGTCQSGYTDKGYRCLCRAGFSSSHCERAPKSCNEIRDVGASTGDGNYRIDPANSGKHLTVFCDMMTEGGGWLRVFRLNVMNSTPPSQLPLETSYRGIEKNQTLLTQTAMKELRRLINFTQLRFHCKKQNPGRTFHIATVNNSLGEAVVQYFSGQTDVLPIACGSFYKMNTDDSWLAKKCHRWGKDEGKYNVGKWGHEVEGVLGRDQNETRLFNHAIFARDKEHWLISFPKRLECDDYDKEDTTVLRGDFWEIFVR